MGPRRDPRCMIRRQSATRYDAVDVRMRLQGLSPSMQDAEESDLCTEMLWVSSYFQEGGSAGFKQESEQDPLVLPDQRYQSVRDAEDEVIVAHWQQFLLPLAKPLLPCVGLTLRTVAIPA